MPLGGKSLEGRVALVTGASRGVGAALASALAEAGCDVACAARSTAERPAKIPGVIEDAVRSVESKGRRALAVETNLADPEQVVAMVEKTVSEFGRLDILVNNAGVQFAGDLALSLRRFDLVMNINLRAPLLATAAAVPHMEKSRGGRIVNVSSSAALIPIPDMMAYGISKIGMERLTVDCARQLQDKNIAVNAFRIDLSVASEGFVANTPTIVDRSTWADCDLAARGIMWLLERPVTYSGYVESMYDWFRREIGDRERFAYPEVAPPTEMFKGLYPRRPSMFEES